MENSNNQVQGSCDNQLSITVEGNQYKTQQQYLTGAQIKELANLPAASELYMTNSMPWKDTAISDEENVDLARPGIEGFYIKKKLKFIIDCTEYEWDKQYILASEIRQLGNIPQDAQVFLSIQGPYDDELINPGDRVDLARPGIERFYFKIVEPIVCIIVNGREKPFTKSKISYEEVLAFAGFPINDSTICTVTYAKGPSQNPSGEMSKGDIVFVKNKMVFNATATNRS